MAQALLHVEAQEFNSRQKPAPLRSLRPPAMLSEDCFLAVFSASGACWPVKHVLPVPRYLLYCAFPQCPGAIVIGVLRSAAGGAIGICGSTEFSSANLSATSCGLKRTVSAHLGPMSLGIAAAWLWIGLPGLRSAGGASRLTRVALCVSSYGHLMPMIFPIRRRSVCRLNAMLLALIYRVWLNFDQVWFDVEQARHMLATCLLECSQARLDVGKLRITKARLGPIMARCVVNAKHTLVKVRPNLASIDDRVVKVCRLLARLVELGPQHGQIEAACGMSAALGQDVGGAWAACERSVSGV